MLQRFSNNLEKIVGFYSLFWLICFQVCYLHGWVHCRRPGAIPAVHAHLPLRVHWRLVDALAHLSFLHGASGRGSAHELWRKQLLKSVNNYQNLLPSRVRVIMLHSAWDRYTYSNCEIHFSDSLAHYSVSLWAVYLTA